MPSQKARLFHTPETLRELQRLIQLSHIPLVQITAVALIRYQLWIMESWFAVTLIFTILHPAPWLTIKRVAAFLNSSETMLCVIPAIQAWLIVFNDPDGRRLRLYALDTHGVELKPDKNSSWLEYGS